MGFETPVCSSYAGNGVSQQIAVSNHHMRKRVLACIAFAVLVACDRSQRNAVQLPSPKASAEPIQGSTPPEVVDELWRLATQGQLLTPQGWKRAGQLCTDPTSFTQAKVIFIVSNEWGPAFEHSATPERAGVTVGFNPLGSIDTNLHYTPEAKSDYIKFGVAYDLVPVPTYTMMYGADGKTLIEKRPNGTRMWKIQGSQGRPFTTVNTAIRYVLAQREKAQDAVIKKNAEETLHILMRLD
jgi:hypothetical protein